jgi:hypothetical protein
VRASAGRQFPKARPCRQGPTAGCAGTPSGTETFDPFKKRVILASVLSCSIGCALQRCETAAAAATTAAASIVASGV